MMKKMLCLCLVLACLMTTLGCERRKTVEKADAYNWYEVFVYSYQDSDGDGVGDMNGLYSRLDYIHDMGYNGIWLMPIMPSPSYHKYDVTDYFDVDPAYGTLEDFRRVVARCHELGMRIIIDMPINHTSIRHPWFLDACLSLQKRTEDSAYIGYYNFVKEQKANHVLLNGTKWYYEEQFAGGNMPDLNLENPAVLEEIKKIFTFWLSDVGVDGFRLDAVTSYVTNSTVKNVEILSKIKQMAEEIKPGSYLVGEAWTSLNDIAEYYKSGIDSFFLFPVSQAEGFIVKSILARSNPAGNFASRIQSVYDAIPEGTWAPFLCNHDTGRALVALQARNSLEKAKFGQGVLNMLSGNVFTYYGDEIGMVGSGDDPNKRLAMYWNDGDMTAQPPGTTSIEYAYPCVDDQLADKHSLLNYCKKINHVRLDYPAIARGENEFVYAEGYVCVMRRTLEEKSVYIAINFSGSKTQEVTLDVKGLAVCEDIEVGAEKAAVLDDGEKCTISLPGYSIVILQIQ